MGVCFAYKAVNDKMIISREFRHQSYGQFERGLRTPFLEVCFWPNAAKWISGHDQ